MDKALVLVLDCAFVYIDDILVLTPHGNSPPPAPAPGVRSAKSGEAASQQESHLGYWTIQYLGFRIGNETIRMVLKKTASLLDTLRPQTKKDVQ